MEFVLFVCQKLNSKSSEWKALATVRGNVQNIGFHQKNSLRLCRLSSGPVIAGQSEESLPRPAPDGKALPLICPPSGSKSSCWSHAERIRSASPEVKYEYSSFPSRPRAGSWRSKYISLTPRFNKWSAGEVWSGYKKKRIH
jgi:hypothetical protein